MEYHLNSFNLPGGGILVKNMYHISAASIDIDPNRGYCKFLSYTLIVDIRDQK